MQGLNVSRPPRAPGLILRIAIPVAGFALMAATVFIGGLPMVSPGRDCFRGWRSPPRR